MKTCSNDTLIGALAGAAATSILLSYIFGRRTSSRQSEDSTTATSNNDISPITIRDFEAAFTDMSSNSKISPAAMPVSSYLCNEGITARQCRDAFDSIRLVPRILRGTNIDSSISTNLNLFGCNFKLPVLVAPTSHHAMYTPDGEAATAKGCVKAGAGYCYNFLLADKHHSEVLKAARESSSCSNASSNGDKSKESNIWLHLYIDKPKEMLQAILNIVKEHGGYSAIILTCDHPHERVQHNMSRIFRPLMKNLRFQLEMMQKMDVPLYGNQGELPGGEGRTMRDMMKLMKMSNKSKSTSLNEDKEFGNELKKEKPSPPVLDWDIIRWLRTQTELPIVVKGILHPDDALKAIECGADGIVVSNHGGRQMDGAIPAITALPAVAAAVKDGNRRSRIPIFVDTGVRTSTDVIKALCLGADGVLVGRPPLWSLAVGGAEGLHTMMESLKDNIQADMQSLGVRSLDELDSSYIWPPDWKKLQDI